MGTVSALIGLLSAVAGIILWWLHNSPARKRERLLNEIKQLKKEYADALARHDGPAVARLQRRMRELEAESGRPLRR
jgi:hypothetical protein